MQGSWSDDNAETLEVVIESFKVVDDELGPSVKDSPQYYCRRGHDINDISEPWKNIIEL
jgi:hypothetical protein